MGDLFKLIGAALITAVLVLTVKKQQQALSAVIAVAGCCVCGALLVTLLQPVLSFTEDISVTAGIDSELLSPLLKSLGVGLLTQFSSDICADAGQTALSKLAQVGGTVLCIGISLPLMQAVLTLIRDMIGG